MPNGVGHQLGDDQGSVVGKVAAVASGPHPAATQSTTPTDLDRSGAGEFG
ncbi:hypothetical protein [Streptomyces sp. NBC_01217]|nr:hypothetical protein OG507_37145 [Streptomyces sp. NBC_01217]